MGIVSQYARMWPRKVFDAREGKRILLKEVPALQEPGVYILYRDDHPYYVGKTKRKLFGRLHDHANKSTDRYFNFWNYFSVFVVPDPKHVDEVEGILIASMTTANSAAPKMPQIRLPKNLATILLNARLRLLADPKGSPCQVR